MHILLFPFFLGTATILLFQGDFVSSRIPRQKISSTSFSRRTGILPGFLNIGLEVSDSILCFSIVHGNAFMSTNSLNNLFPEETSSLTAVHTGDSQLSHFMLFNASVFVFLSTLLMISLGYFRIIWLLRSYTTSCSAGLLLFPEYLSLKLICLLVLSNPTHTVCFHTLRL